MTFIDTHCHLEICNDLPGLIERANERGVNVILSAGTDVETNRKALEFARKYDCVRACLGIYPVDGLKISDEELDKEIDFIKWNKVRVVGIGEVGLDLKHGDDLGRQIDIFSKFIELAKKLDKPLIVHSRQAEKEAVEVLEKAGAEKVVMHCFCGDLDLIDRIVENGWSFSIPAKVVFDEGFQKLVGRVDIDRLLCETDSPFLHYVKGEKDNEPKNVVESYKKIAEIKGMTLGEVEVKVGENFERLFGKV